MDNGWAIVIGAGIALVGSAVVPWLRDSLTSATQRRRELRGSQAQAIRELIAAAAARYAERHSKNVLKKTLVQSETALASFALLVPTKDTAIYDMSERAFGLMDDPDYASTAFVMLSILLPKWYRGEITAKEALVDYLADVDRETRRRMEDPKSTDSS